MKRKIMRQLRSLEQEEMVSSKDDYQEIINSIAKVITHTHTHTHILYIKYLLFISPSLSPSLPSSLFSQDIRNQHRHRQQRKVELKRLQETMEKLSIKAQFCEEQMEYYQQYVKACLESLAKASR